MQPHKTLGESVYYLVQNKLTQTPEFQALVTFYGRDKLMRLYKEEREKRQVKADPQLSDKDDV